MADGTRAPQISCALLRYQILQRTHVSCSSQRCALQWPLPSVVVHVSERVDPCARNARPVKATLDAYIFNEQSCCTNRPIMCCEPTEKSARKTLGRSYWALVDDLLVDFRSKKGWSDHCFVQCSDVLSEVPTGPRKRKTDLFQTCSPHLHLKYIVCWIAPLIRCTHVAHVAFLDDHFRAIVSRGCLRPETH